MTNVIKANFNGTQILFQDNAYLHATAIASRFGKKAKDYLKSAKTQEYIGALIRQLNSKGRKIPFDENQLLIIKKGSPVNGGGTWLHPKLAIDFARWLSAEFAVWCDEQIEKILHGKQTEQPKLDDLSTVKSREPLKDAVNTMVHKCHLSYSDCWRMVHQRFRVGHIDQLTESEVTDAIAYVHDKIIEGELIPREPAQEKHYINKNKKNRLAGITLMQYGSLARMHQNEELRKLDKMLTQTQDQLKKAMQYNGALYDGFSEAWFQLSFAPDECREACKRANEWFNERYGN